MSGTGTLYAISDLHVGYQDNRDLLGKLVPPSDQDWLIVAGDVAEIFDDVIGTLSVLRERFAKVIWAPGNHELWTVPNDRVQLRGEERYQALVEACRAIEVVTPEDDYPVWTGAGGPATIAPLFLLYDYSWLAPGTANVTDSLAKAYQEGIVCADERFLFADPYEGRAQWCHARIETTEKRLAEVDPAIPTVLVNHFPLRREPTLVMHYQVFAQWCGTELTADWHLRYRAAACVYGHLHIPRRTSYDGVRFEEVSLGYPREWKARPQSPRLLVPVFPDAAPDR
jgi:3',5'-cyclic AMP phosphodiesterase CpdA